jgi:hypothetical protein
MQSEGHRRSSRRHSPDEGCNQRAIGGHHGGTHLMRDAIRGPSEVITEALRGNYLMRDAIRGPSEVITEALRGNSEALIISTHQRHSSALIRGTHQRHSSEGLIRGTHQRDSSEGLIRGTHQRQSDAIRRNQNLKRELQLRLWGEGKRNQSQSVAIRTSSASCSFDPKPHSRNSPLPPNVTIHLPLARGCSMAAASM